MLKEQVLGVDAAKKGWVGIVLDGNGAFFQAVMRPTIAELVEACSGVAVVAIDMPIGLPDRGSRQADAQARRLLGGRQSSIFTTPTRSAMEADDYDSAAAAQQASTGKGLSKQAYALRSKLLEVDKWMRTPPDEPVVEVHPEVSFVAMNVLLPLRASKHSWTGQAERRELLRAAGIDIPTDIGNAGLCAVDDVLDAAAAAWTAHRIQAGVAQRLPDTPERFSDGLESAIHF